MKDINTDLSTLPANSVVVVPEPLDQSGDRWHEMPQDSFSIIKNGEVKPVTEAADIFPL
ncbi:MAG: hypothetical protein U1E36_09235 [Rickettsiales bacterium]